MSRTKVEKNQELLTTEIAEPTNRIDSGSDISLKGSLPLIKCECGTEILLLPDLEAMNRAIAIHTNEHANKERTSNKYNRTSSNISQLLSQLSLRKIIEQNDI
jgi:hypothetical protein